MAKTLATGGSNAVAVLANQTRFLSIGDAGTSWAAGESSAQALSDAGVYSLLYMRTSSNTITATSTFTFRVNAASVNQTFQYTTGASGERQDTSNTDAVSSGDKVDVQGATGATGTSMILEIIGVVFAATTNSTKNHGCNGNTGSLTLNNVTRYVPLSGILTSTLDTTEGNVQVKARTALTLKNMCASCSGNSRTTTTTLGTRINGVNGNVLCSIGAGVTTLVTDVTHTDAVSVADLINYYFTFGASAESVLIRDCNIISVTTNNQFQFTGGKSGGETVAANITRNFKCGGDVTQNATELSTQHLASIVFTAQKLGINVISNTITLNSTFKFRKNGADGNQVATITLSVGGYDEDTTNTDAVATTDEINYQMVTGTTGVSLVFGAYGMVGVVAATATNVISHLINLMGLGN